MGWNTLGNHSNPLTSQVVIPVSGEFESPKRGVNAQAYLAMLQMVPHMRVLMILSGLEFKPFRNPLTHQGSHGLVRRQGFRA